MIFWNRKRIENEDLTTKEELRLMKARVTRVESEILDCMTAIEIIRNKVLRKIQSKKQPEEEENGEEWAGIPKSTIFK